MKWKKVFLGLTILLLIVIIVNNFPKSISQEEYYENIKRGVNNNSYTGIIIDKYIDENHARRVIKIKSLNRNNITTLDLFFETSDFFAFLEVGDTLEKFNNSLDLKLKRSQLDTTLRFTLSNIKRD